MIFAGASLLHANESQLQQETDQLISKLVELAKEETIEQTIQKLFAANEKHSQDIVRLRMDLAKMRVNQGGKGAIKPGLQQAANRIIQSIHEKTQKIYANKSEIQRLQELNPNRLEPQPHKITTNKRK